MKAIISIFIVLTSIILCLFIYSTGLDGTFLLDSNKLNSLEKFLQPDTEITFKNIFFGNISGRLLSQLTFLANIFINSSIDPFWIKLTNLMIHIVNGLLIFYLSKLLIENSNITNSHTIAILVFSIWMLSPINMSGVLYAIQRMNQLSVFFTLASLIIYIRFRLSTQKNLHNNLHNAFVISLIVICSVLGFLSKENAILIPLYIILIELFFFKTYLTRIKPRSITIIVISVILFLSALVSILHSLDLLNYQSRSFSLPERLMTQSRVIFIYLSEIILPRSTATGLYNDGIIISKSLLSPFTTLLSVSGLVIILLSSAFLKINEHFRLAYFGIFFFLCGHLLESSVFPLEIYFEHRNYLPSFGIYFSLIITLSFALNKASNILKLTIACLYISLHSFVGFAKANVWSDPINAYSAAIKRPYPSPRAYSNMSQALLNEGKISEANRLLYTIEQGYEHQALRARLQIIFNHCKTNTEIPESLYKKINQVTLKELDIEISQALENIISIYKKTSCSVLNINKLRAELISISEEYKKNNKDSWHIDYYIVQTFILNHDTAKAVSYLEMLFNNGKQEAGHYLKHLIRENSIKILKRHSK